MRTHTLAASALLLGSLALVGCSSVMEVTVRNATRSPITATVRVDRVGSRGTLLASDTLNPGQQTTLSSDSAPQLEYIELAIGRPGDLGDVPLTKRLPRGKSSWTVAADADSWTGFAIVEGIDNPAPSTVSPASATPPVTTPATTPAVHD